nr:MAG TPA: ArsC family reductase [Caudoviricetes sp.]
MCEEVLWWTMSQTFLSCWGYISSWRTILWRTWCGVC